MAIDFYNPTEVKKLRQASGLTQKAVAEAIEKDRVTIARFENGIAASLDLLIDYTNFFGEDYRNFLLPVSRTSN